MPESSSPVVEIGASNSRSYLRRENGEYWYWGGFFYGTGAQEIISGFHLLQEDAGLEGKEICGFQMGFAHCVVMTEETGKPKIEVDV